MKKKLTNLRTPFKDPRTHLHYSHVKTFGWKKINQNKCKIYISSGNCPPIFFIFLADLPCVNWDIQGDFHTYERFELGKKPQTLSGTEVGRKKIL